LQHDTFKDSIRLSPTFETIKVKSFDFRKLKLELNLSSLTNKYSTKQESDGNHKYYEFQRLNLKVGRDFAFQNHYQEMILQPITPKLEQTCHLKIKPLTLISKY
jgi:hypothetical protein